MELYYESMTRVVHQLHPWEQLVIRCWRQEHSFSATTSNDNTVEILKTIKGVMEPDPTPLAIANELIKMDRMNAVEVLDAQGCGQLIYKDWP